MSYSYEENQLGTEKLSLQELLENKIVIIDGAMGTVIQEARLTEEDFRGVRFGHTLPPE